MNEHVNLERLVAGHIADEGVTPPSDTFYDELFARAGGSGQRPEWLALIKEPPMQTNSHLAVGSPTVRVAAVLAATLLLALTLAAAGAGAQRLLASNGPIVVAQDGSGDFTTIGEAVAAAEDGDEVIVTPGTYAEAVVIDKDIALRGDGPREEVILEFAEDGPTIPSWAGQVPYGLMFVDTEAIVGDLTVRGPNAAAAFVFVGGAPTLEHVANELGGEYSGRAHTSVAVVHGAGGTIRDSLLDGPAFDFGDQRIPEHEDIAGSGHFVAEDNVLDSCFGLDVTDGSAFVRNTITDDGGIELSLVGSGSVLIAENDLATIQLLEQSDGFTIRDNQLIDNDTALLWSAVCGTIEMNDVSGGHSGILIGDGSPAVTGNIIEGVSDRGLVAEVGTSPVLSGNRSCGNGSDYVVMNLARPVDDGTNEFCFESLPE